MKFKKITKEDYRIFRSPRSGNDFVFWVGQPEFEKYIIFDDTDYPVKAFMCFYINSFKMGQSSLPPEVWKKTPNPQTDFWIDQKYEISQKQNLYIWIRRIRKFKNILSLYSHFCER